jgi:hypothetical protein
MDPVTYMLLQAAGAATNAAINAYLSAPPKPTFQGHDGQETLFDEDNWARVIDIQEILCLVRPFISAVQNLEITAIQQASSTSTSSRGRTLDESKYDDPPPYIDTPLPADPEAYLKEYSYRIICTTQRLVETLTVAGAGPSGSSPRAWNLNVNASTELGIGLLELYRATTRTMQRSPSGCFLSLVWVAMSLYDADLLERVEGLFKPVGFRYREEEEEEAAPPTYLLRLPNEKRYLDIRGTNHGNGIQWRDVARISAQIFYPLHYRVYKHFFEGQEQNTDAPLQITKGGDSGPEISFFPVSTSRDEKEKRYAHNVRFGAEFRVAKVSRTEKREPRASPGESEYPIVCVIHCDDRYRAQSSGRVVYTRDRIILKHSITGKLLSRKKVGDDSWVVDFGLSDDNQWSIALPI